MVSFSEDTPGRHDVIPPGRYARLIVSDTGSGMSAETLSHIFEPFFTTKEQGKGTGLGLSTVYGIVKQSGGYIWVYSEPSGGTSFKIYFPEVRENASGTPAAEAAAPPGGTENVLLVEDDAPVRAAIVRMLREAGYTVAEASNGVEALAIGKEAFSRFSLLITDLMMPKMGGIELSAAVRQLVPDLPVLYISGYSEELVAVRENIGANSFFIQKPVSSDALLRKVRDALASGAAKK
jgi:CheY-like chemotaxis protein